MIKHGMMKRAMIATAAVCGLLAAGGGTARASGDAVIVGLLDDLSGPTADLSGKGKVVAAQMAIDDFGGNVLGKPVKLLASDHQNKPEIASTQAREWYDRDGVDMITGMLNSAVALAVRAIARERGKVDVIAGGTADSLIGADCSPTGMIASVKMVENRAHAEVAIVQAALGGKVMAEAASFGINSAMASTCM